MLRWILVGLLSIVHAQSTQVLPVVSVMDVKKQDFQPVVSMPGNIYAMNGADLALESTGIITNINVVSGQTVKAGDLLIELDNSSEKASYDAAVTSAKYAEVEFNRQKELFAQGVISAETYETAQTQLAEAISGMVTAKVALDHRSLFAPFDGQIGIVQLSVGEYISAGTSLLSLLDLSKMRVDFSVSQELFSQLKPGLKLNIRNPIQDKSAETVATSPMVDSSSGQVAVQGLFDNVDPLLPSGLLVSVDLKLTPIPNQLFIPASAVSYSLSGDYVYVVDNIQTSNGKTTGVASQVIVTLGQIGNDQIIIKSGLKEGQKVVSAGAVKLSGSGVNVELDTSTPLPN